MAKAQPRLIQGGIAADERGSVRFVNDFDFRPVKRMYVIENCEPGYIRAWHGHRIEEKYVFVSSGAALIGVADMDTGKTQGWVLSEHHPSILYIPAGYANGSMAIRNGTRIIHFSTVSLGESKDDDYRFPVDKFTDIWAELR